MPRIVHFEIHAAEPERAIQFYSQAFGWSFQPWDGPMPYWTITTGPDDEPGINGGLVGRQGEAPTEGAAVNAFVCTVDVPNIDEAVETVTGLGAEIVWPKNAIPNVGWLAYAKDPFGNRFGMMEEDAEAA